MGKDPAFLFYPSDYLGGTMGMTFEEKGAYIELLICQFNRGHMTEHMIGHIIGQTLWDSIRHKFIKDENGLFYNERLDEEKFKRQAFTESRRNNKTGKNQYSKSGHMTYHMENRNRDVNNNPTNTTIHGEASENLHPEAGQTDTTEKTMQKDLPKTEPVSPNLKWKTEYISSPTRIHNALTTFRDNGLKATEDNVKHLCEKFFNEIEAKEDHKQTLKLFGEHFISWAKMHGKKYEQKSKSRIGL